MAKEKIEPELVEHSGLGRVKLDFSPSNQSFKVPPGVSVFDAASWNGIAIDSTCGGHGTCKKCKVQITEGIVPISRLDIRAFSQEELKNGWRLACVARATENLAITVPAMTTRPKAATVGVGRQVILRPAVQKRYLELDEPTLHDQRPDIQRVKDDIDWARKNNVGFIFNADANFGMFKERDLEIAKLFREAADEGNLEAINIQYSKNSTEVIFEIAKILGDISRGVTLSVQTMNEPTLKAIKRKNMSINKISEQIEKSKEYGVKTYTELILGLPEETLDTWKDGFSKILECGQHESIDVWFCQMFGDTELNSTTSREVYGIKTIKAEDYVSFGNDRDYDGVTETIELISETNTMTNNQLIEAYMYGWLIVQFHIAGYTQIVAKHYYENLNISYRVFYDTLFEFIKLDNGLIGEHYREIESAVNHYMKTGKILKKGKHGHTLHAGSFAFMFTHKDEIFKLVENATQKITPIKTDIISLQRAFIFDEETQYPFYLTCEDKKYKIDTEFKSFDKNDPHTVFILRRKGLLKNQLCKV